MRILIDTNILISAMLNPNGAPYQAYLKAVTYPNHAIICDQNIEELKRIFNNALDRFLSVASLSIEIVQVPVEEDSSESLIRDFNDRPILRAAIFAKADILLTGDKDFLESGIVTPKIMTALEFINLKTY